MALQYRQLQAPEQLNTNIPDNGAASAAESLARVFKQASDTSAQIGTKIAQTRGAAAGSQQGATGDPKFQNGFFRYSAYSEAYNNAAMRSYSIKAQADAEDTSARLQVEAGTDASAFQASFGKVRDETLKAAPPEARGMLADMFNQHMGEGLKNVMTARALEVRNNDRTDLAEGMARSTERIGNLQGKDDPAYQSQIDEEQVKLSMMIDGAQKDGTLSDIEAAALHTNAQHAITQQTVVSRFQAVLDNPYGDPVGFIERLHAANEKDQILLPKEKAQLEEHLLATLREKNSLASAASEAARRAEAARYEAGDRNATADLLSGTLTERKLLTAVTSQDLKPEVARTLLNELQKGDSGVDDSEEAFAVKTDLLHYTESDIATNSKLSWKTRGEMILKRRELADGWRGTQAAREGEARIDRALGIVPGTIIQLLPDDVKKQRQQALTNWYNVVDGMAPADRQNNVIGMADEMARQYIRKNKSTEAGDQRRIKQRYIETNKGGVGLSPEAKKSYDAQLSKYDANIATAEAEAARK